MLSLDVLVLRGAFPAANPVELSFPLKGSRYSLLEGGDSPITNPFDRAGPRGRVALDIMKRNGLEKRSRWLMPIRLGAYEIFGGLI